MTEPKLIRMSVVVADPGLIINALLDAADREAELEQAHDDWESIRRWHEYRKEILKAFAAQIAQGGASISERQITCQEWAEKLRKLSE